MRDFIVRMDKDELIEGREFHSLGSRLKVRMSRQIVVSETMI